MTTEQRGLDLLDAAIEQIEKHPETWQQFTYRCGSGMCLAGWIGVLAGGEWASSWDHPRGEWMLAEPEDDPLYITESDYGEIIHVAERAERLIGVSRYVDDSRDLFYGGNRLANLKAMRDDLRAREAKP